MSGWLKFERGSGSVHGKICVTNEREVWSVKHDEGEMYGSKSVPSDFENKKPLNSKHWIFMHRNNVSGFEFQSNQRPHLKFLTLNLWFWIFNIEK